MTDLKNRTATLLHSGSQLIGTITTDHGTDSDGSHNVTFTVTGIPPNNPAMVKVGETFGVDVSEHNFALNPREFKLSIHDLDGEVHEYNFFAVTPWEIMTHVMGKMNKDGDFYGHDCAQTMNIDICELVDGTLGADAIDLSRFTLNPRKVVIEVRSGVAEVVQCPEDVEVEITDHDNEING